MTFSNNVTTVPINNMTREDWLQERRKSIGGSDASAVIGLNKYKSPYALWADKTGRLPDQEDNEAMRLGRDLEDYVAHRWMEETGLRCRKSAWMYRNRKYPWAHADVDRLVDKEQAILEIKTTSSMPTLKKVRNGEYPETYYCQMVHYLGVTGAQRIHLAVYVLGKGLYCFCLERDEDEIAALMAAEADFWNLVQTDTPPAVDGSPATESTLQTLYRESDGSEVQLMGREGAVREYLALKKQRDALDDRIGEIENLLKSDLQEAERGTAGSYVVSWKSQVRQTFQAAAFRAEHPEIDLTNYYKRTVSRPFKVTEKEN